MISRLAPIVGATICVGSFMFVNSSVTAAPNIAQKPSSTALPYQYQVIKKCGSSIFVQSLKDEFVRPFIYFTLRKGKVEDMDIIGHSKKMTYVGIRNITRGSAPVEMRYNTSYSGLGEVRTGMNTVCSSK